MVAKLALAPPSKYETKMVQSCGPLIILYGRISSGMGQILPSIKQEIRAVRFRMRIAGVRENLPLSTEMRHDAEKTQKDCTISGKDEQLFNLSHPTMHISFTRIIMQDLSLPLC
jgi:hypothetical protein